jgi:hypothetical protein
MDHAKLTFHAGRHGFAYGESAFVLQFMPSSTHGNLTVDVMNSFFEHERFPPNWFRRATPFDFSGVGTWADLVEEPFPIDPGAKNASGVYVDDVEMNNVRLSSAFLFHCIEAM